MSPVVLLIATPNGNLNWPSPVPDDPNWVTYSPFVLNSCSRSRVLSTTHKSPEDVSASRVGSWNWPLPDPEEPNAELYEGSRGGSVTFTGRPHESRSVVVVKASGSAPPRFPRGLTAETC